MREVRIHRRRRPRVRLRTARAAGDGRSALLHSSSAPQENAASERLARLRPTGPTALRDLFRLGRLRSIPLRFRRGGTVRLRVEMTPRSGRESARPIAQRSGLEGFQAPTLPRGAPRCTLGGRIDSGSRARLRAPRNGCPHEARALLDELGRSHSRTIGAQWASPLFAFDTLLEVVYHTPAAGLRLGMRRLRTQHFEKSRDWLAICRRHGSAGNQPKP